MDGKIKHMLTSKRARAIVDILLIVGLLLSVISDKSYMTAFTHTDYWSSFHCITGILWFLVMIVHVLQHWRFIKAFRKKKVILKNKITAATILVFFLMSLSIIFLIAGISYISLEYHNIVAHIFLVTVVVHAIDKSKRFVSLFRKR